MSILSCIVDGSRFWDLEIRSIVSGFMQQRFFRLQKSEVYFRDLDVNMHVQWGATPGAGDPYFNSKTWESWDS